jgi:hypothetical protein
MGDGPRVLAPVDYHDRSLQEARKTTFELTVPVIPFGLIVETTVEGRWSSSLGTWIMIGGGLLFGMLLGGAGWIVYQ